MKYWFGFLIVLAVLIFPNFSFASEQFQEKYNVFYEVSESGETAVTESVIIRNLSDTSFGSEYTSTIPSTQVKEISAVDSFGPLKTNVQKDATLTRITVHFSEQVIGRGKDYGWTLRYKTLDFAQKNGYVWQFSVPKISPIKNLEQFNTTLSVPLSFGDPSRIIPNPLKQRDAGSHVEYQFGRDQLLSNGITAYFGKQQYFDFSLNYVIKNQGLLPNVMPVYIPDNGLFQEILVNSIEPKPENVEFDENGNSIAYFKLRAGEQKEIRVLASVKLDLDRNGSDLPTGEQLNRALSNTVNWDTLSPQVTEALKVALENNPNEHVLSNEEKARRIYDYVVHSLQFGDSTKVDVFPRNSASSILNDANNRYCLDFVNVFIAMSRAAQIPTEQVVGLAYSTNKVVRPTCFENASLHTWARIYDPQKGWLMVDPSWGATSGIEFFSFSDLSHIILAVKNDESAAIKFPGHVALNFSQNEFLPLYSYAPSIQIPEEITAGFPYKINFVLTNNGNTTLPGGSVKVSSKVMTLHPLFSEQSDEYLYPPIPSFGSIELPFSIKSRLPWDSLEDELKLTIGNKVIVKKVTVKPIFQSSFFGAQVFGLLGLMFVLYILVLILHFRESDQKIVAELKKDVLLLPAPYKKKTIRKRRVTKKKKK